MQFTALLVWASIAGVEADTPIRLTHDGLDKQRPMLSPDGKTLVFARHEAGGTNIALYLWDFDQPGAAPRRLTDSKTPEYNAAFSPDGKQLLLVVIPRSGTQGNCDIAMIDASGSGLKTIVGDLNGKLAHQDWPAWSPDGKRFAFSSTHEGNQEIYAADADGSNLQRLTQSPGQDSHPCWTPDGRRIVFTTDRWSGQELASMAADGTEVTRLTTSPGFDDYATVSPNGTKIAFVSNRDGNFEIYLAGIDGSDATNVSDHAARDTFPTFTPNGKSLIFLSERDGQADLYRLDLETIHEKEADASR